jgi:hypothetical protein
VLSNAKQPNELAPPQAKPANKTKMNKQRGGEGKAKLSPVFLHR